ncbi:uncharacterized protein LOC116339276 [Contarinia nasturtii]|uniref:uncharacterized protein LOC116339276 n=1 Tax=Contarinia nasturtii TaxID=265458 RepID=UPI0012D49304|nr:uncharacterized protein LOC116339276 [Contarinia nasturtii]
MEFFDSFISVFIKYDFNIENRESVMSKEWTECRMNVKPTPGSYRNVQINVYPQNYNELKPHFSIAIDYEKIRSGHVRSYSRQNVYGILWCSDEHDMMKKCRIFIAFEDKAMHQKFSKYFRKLLKFFNMYNNCENDAVYKVSDSENFNSSVSNEAEQITANNSGDGITSHTNASPSSVQIMRISDASGHYEDVILRPKTEEKHQKQNNRRLARPFAVISGLFKSHRERNSTNQDENDENSQHEHHRHTVKPKSKRRSWNIFKSKKKNRDESPLTFQHFQEPLNVERVSLPIGPIANDAEWYDLNKEEMSLFEARISMIVNEFNNNCNQTVGESESESIHHCDLSRYLTVSSNILWSHNLSLSIESSNGNASNVNLLGANINKDQIHSSVYIEDNYNDISKSLPQPVNALDTLNLTFVSTDSDGYAIMQPISSEKYVKPKLLIDMKSDSPADDSQCNVSDDSSNISSGFGSDFDACSPQKLSVNAPATNSPATSDFLEACPSPATPLKNMHKKTLKRCRLQLKSRKLFGMLRVKQYRPSKSYVTPSSQNDSPILPSIPPPPQSISPECTKKIYKRTPFKVHLLKEVGVNESLHKLSLHQSLRSLHI